ncbi:DUF4142 domain-containing protein [Microvirga arsenatis]|uniref:DUF4142 domain-containing protein n=1 Tax=Microvirga arsenatis TaxID=2692265 RepID=A0ABW9YYI3_9HYPH|nr:DUF4142 domain-containing protein [Microvirga arsenatis]NBJ11099.1 DUF4142 domain-containing protein [Microvirga arsenatis]NBJ25372.1 DUF4142 domain-containing protein [Microvirga arsenatis]
MKVFKPLLTALLLAAAAPAVWAQGQGSANAPAPARVIEPEEFVRLAYSSATLQGQAATLASSRETRPEVKSYAAAQTGFRQDLLKRIEAFARERNLPLPSVKEFEHQVIIENMEPLDYLALSRRYAEIQLQALDQEIGIYRAASQSPHQAIKAFADQVLPDLEQRRGGAQKMWETVRP